MGGGHDHNFRLKNYNFLFLLSFDAEAFKTCKNTIKLFNLCALPCLGVVEYMTVTAISSKIVFGLIEVGDGGVKNFTFKFDQLLFGCIIISQLVTISNEKYVYAISRMRMRRRLTFGGKF